MACGGYVDPPPPAQTVLSGRKLPLHATRPTPHGASRLVRTKSVWLVKTRRVPSRRCRDARAYGHMTTAMHDMWIPPRFSYERADIYLTRMIYCVILVKAAVVLVA